MVVRMPPGLKVLLMHHKSRLAEGRRLQREICPLRKLLAPLVYWLGCLCSLVALLVVWLDVRFEV